MWRSYVPVESQAKAEALAGLRVGQIMRLLPRLQWDNTETKVRGPEWWTAEKKLGQRGGLKD
jgi:hypothetical protein